MALVESFLSKNWLPNRLKELHHATFTFKKYMTDVYEEEKKSIANGNLGGGNLMTSVIRASAGSTVTGNLEDRGGLTESEIYGNIFVFNFAGYDTTAHTLAFAIVFLAANPSVQIWLSEELRYVLVYRDPEEWNYQAAFPRLSRCLAVLVSISPSQWLCNEAQQSKVGDAPPLHPCTDCQIYWQRAANAHSGQKDHRDPTNTMLIPKHVAVHTHPRYWGHDCLDWRPSR